MASTQNLERQLMPFVFQDHTVRTVLIDGAPWFIAKDVCDVLKLKNPTVTLLKFPENEKGLSTTYTLGGEQHVLIVNEPGLYRLIFKSRKPEAEHFKTWVFTTVLPQIRQTGFFFPPSCNPDTSRIFLNIMRYFETTRARRQAALDIGKNLVMLKASVRHGEFLDCLSKMRLPSSTASNYMKIYRKFAGYQEAAQQFSVTQLLIMSALPDEGIERIIKCRDILALSRISNRQFRNAVLQKQHTLLHSRFVPHVSRQLPLFSVHEMLPMAY
jgi:prophage antirepressor-like protein